MDVPSVLRFTVLVLAAAAMVVGVLVIAGVLVHRYLPEDYRILMGVVVFLYGAYRFTVTYFRQSARSPRETHRSE